MTAVVSESCLVLHDLGMTDVTRTIADDREPSPHVPGRHRECVQQLSSGRASPLLWAAELSPRVLAVPHGGPRGRKMKEPWKLATSQPAGHGECPLRDR